MTDKNDAQGNPIPHATPPVIMNPLTGKPLNHSKATDEEWLALSDELKQLDYAQDAAGLALPKPDGNLRPVFATVKDVFDFAERPENNIRNPQAKPITNGIGFVLVDLDIDPPQKIFRTNLEALYHGRIIGRSDLIPTWQPKLSGFLLEEPPETGIASHVFDEDLGKFIVSYNDGRTALVDPPKSSGTGIPSRIPIEGTDSVFFNDGHGNTAIVKKTEAAKPDFELGDIEKRGGSTYLETSPGRFELVPDEPVDDVVETIQTADGPREFVRRDGQLIPLDEKRPLTFDQQIDRALDEGNIDAVLALQDLNNRPTSMEAFTAAMQFAQAPGDQVAISAIAQGHQLVSPPPAGEVQRIADPPEFLMDAYTRLQRNISGGGATGGDFMDVLNGIATEGGKAKKNLTNLQGQLDASEAKLLAVETQVKTDAAIQAGIDKRFADAKANPTELIPEGGLTAKRGLTADRGLPVGGTSVSPSGETPDIEDIIRAGGPAGAGGFFNDPSLGETPKPQEAGLTAGGRSTAPLQGGTPFEAVLPSSRKRSPSRQRVIELQNVKYDPNRVSNNILTKGKTFLEAYGIKNRGTLSEIEGSEPDGGENFAGGGTIDDGSAIVGENGPELLLAPIGSQVIPLDGMNDKSSLAKLKKMMGIKGLAHGGTVEDLLPIGVRQVLHGVASPRTRRRLSTASGIGVLSGQARQNILPEDLDVLDRLRRESGIPAGAFAQEQASALPGQLRRRPSRFAPRVSR